MLTVQNITAFTKNKRVSSNNKSIQNPTKSILDPIFCLSALQHCLGFQYAVGLQSKDLDGALSVLHVFVGRFAFPQSLSTYANI